MNAEEAIENIEKRLNEYKKQTAAYEADMHRDPFTLEYLLDKDEALSVVLESAKFLHEELIRNEETGHYSDYKKLYLNVDYDEVKKVSNGLAKAIGLEKGADE